VLVLGAASVGGKGRLVAEYAAAAGAKLLFAEYQAGWTDFSLMRDAAVVVHLP